MASYTHLQWLSLHQEQEEFSLQTGSRLQNIAKCFPRASLQYPSLIFFIVKKSKAAAMRAMYPESRVSDVETTASQISASIQPQSTTFTQCSSSSCLDCAKVLLRTTSDSCRENATHPMTWSDSTGQWEDLVEHINARSLPLFIDVVCIFAEDCGGLEEVVMKLTSWTCIGSASTLPSTVRPRVVVVTNFSPALPCLTSTQIKFLRNTLSLSTQFQPLEVHESHSWGLLNNDSLSK